MSDEPLHPATAIDFDVAVAGCGPVGAMTAILLAQAGHRVLVLERYPAPYPRPRAVSFDDEVARLLVLAGLPEVMAISLPAREYVWQNADRQTLLRFDMPLVGFSGWPTTNMFDQPTLERLLGQRMTQLPAITVQRGHTVTAVEQTRDGVELTSRRVDDTDTTRWRARYVVGCDGANSFIRTQMDTDVEDLGFFYDWLIVDVVLTEPRVFEPDNVQICDPQRPTTAVCGGPGRRRWEFLRMPGETVAELVTEEMAWRLLEPWSVTPDNALLQRHVVYTFQARWATDWRDRRLFLAGDAAHLMPPFAGQGMGSGLRDAANLAWKLDMSLSGRTSDTLLDTYTAERRGHVQHAIGASVALGSVICATDPDAVARRDAHMLAGGGDPAQVLPPVAPPVLGDGLLQKADDGSPGPGAGQLAPQGRVARGTQVAFFDDIVGHGFVVISVADARVVLSDDQQASLAAIGAHLVTMIAPGTEHASNPSPEVVVDVDDVYLPHLQRAGAEAAVVRPDFYTFGAAPSLNDLPALIDDLFDQLGLNLANLTSSRERTAL